MKYAVLPTKTKYHMYYIPDSDDQKGDKDIYIYIYTIHNFILNCNNYFN